MHCLVSVGDVRIAVVHGDATSLSGWDFECRKVLHRDAAPRFASLFDCAKVAIFASTHTCLPVARLFGECRARLNNGSAGMPNRRGQLFGLVTRISIRPLAIRGISVYEARLGSLYLNAVAVRYDQGAWPAKFDAQWPTGSPAATSYRSRLIRGANCPLVSAIGPGSSPS